MIEGIIGGLSVLAVGTCGHFLLRYYLRVRKYFRLRWKEARRLEPEDLLHLRASQDLGFNPYYFERAQDNEIREAILAGRSVLVVGEPLSGKTRAVHQSLVGLPDNYDVLVPREVDIDPDSFCIPFHLRKLWNREIVVFDDINRLAGLGNFSLMLEACHRRGAVLVATCRLEEEAQLASETRARDWQAAFRRRVLMPALDQRTACLVAAEAGIDFPGLFFGPVGSLFLPLEDLRQEFRSCSDEEKAILDTLRALHLAGAHSVKEGVPGASVESACSTLHGIDKSRLEWRRMLRSLQDRGFIKVAGDSIRCEEALLEKVVESEGGQPEAVSSLLPLFRGNPEMLVRMGNAVSEAAVGKGERRYLALAAIEPYKEALKIRTLHEFPMDYGMIQNNLGTAYGRLAEVEDKAGNCRRAIEACGKALKVRTLDEFPMQYANTQTNLGIAYWTLAKVEDKAGNCNRAIGAFGKALEVYTLDTSPERNSVVARNLALAQEFCGCP